MPDCLSPHPVHCDTAPTGARRLPGTRHPVRPGDASSYKVWGAKRMTTTKVHTSNRPIWHPNIAAYGLIWTFQFTPWVNIYILSLYYIYILICKYCVCYCLIRLFCVWSSLRGWRRSGNSPTSSSVLCRGLMRPQMNGWNTHLPASPWLCNDFARLRWCFRVFNLPQATPHWNWRLWKTIFLCQCGPSFASLRGVDRSAR